MDRPASTSSPIPTTIGRYEVLLPIASGGMGRVFLARSRGARGFERHVAIKLSHAHLSEEAEFAATLLDEAKLATQIRHRNVVSVLDLGEDPLGLFLVMDYVEGDTLAGLVSRGKKVGKALPEAVGMRILVDALAGLNAAHELRDEAGTPLSVVHRDFTPQNILVGVDGVAQLTDFGVAKAGNRVNHTATGVVKGKIAYMAPEQARARSIDRRADLWSAGVVAWEILAGRRLFPTSVDGDVATLLKIVTERPPRLRTVTPSVSAELEAVVARALEPELDARLDSASDFARQLVEAFESSRGRLATPEEVGACVEEIAGARLAERRRQIQRAIELRADYSKLAEASIEHPLGSVAGTPTPQRTGGTALPLVPPPAIGPESVEALALATPPPAESQELMTSAGPTVIAAPLGDHGARRAPNRRAALIAGGVAAVVAASLLVALAWRREPAHEPPPVAVAAPTASVPVPPPTVSAVPAPAPVESAPPTPAGEVNVVANAKIAALRIGARNVALAAPSTEVSFTRKPDESGEIRLDLVSVDGRRASAVVSPDATEVKVTFSTSAVAPPQQRVAKPSCDPPYTITPAGVRIPKRECF